MPNADISNQTIPDHPDKINFKIVLGFWIVICIVFVARTLFAGGGAPLLNDSDDAMRLVVVQDLLGGQGWYDHVQHRLNVPYGVQIHWSRLIDLPIAALILIAQPFFGDSAPMIAAWIWPLLLLLVLLYLSVRITIFMVGPEGLLPGLVLPVLSAAVLVEFGPGRIDHHNVQIILVLAMLYGSLRAWRTPRWAIFTGIVSATSLAIAMEALPQVITVVVVFGLFFVADHQKGKTARLFGVSFALATLVHLALFLPAKEWSTAACDAISLVYVAAAMGVGATFTIVSLLPLKSWQLRLLSGAIVGGLLVGLLLVFFPQCAGGPYGAIDPWLKARWLTQIVEAEPVWNSLLTLPRYTLGIIVPPLAALLVLAIFIIKTQTTKRAEWLVLGLFLVAGILVVIAQIRGARLVAGMVAPIGAWAIIQVRQKYLENQSILGALGLVGTWLIFTGVAVALVAGFVLPGQEDDGPDTVEALNAGSQNTSSFVLSESACRQPDIFVDLASLPPERIMGPLDMGAHLLAFTPHSVVGAPYHRNQQGLIDTLNFFNLPLDEARTILDQRGISLIVTCPYLPEMKGFADAPDTSFLQREKAGTLPDWIADVTLPGSILNVYAVIE